jgi:hydrogenase maturation protease
MSCDTLIVGFGSAHGDDRVGWLVADQLKTRLGSRPEIHRAIAALDLLDWLDGVQRLVLCDGCRGAGPVGSRHLWRWPVPELPFIRSAGTHDLGIPAVLTLAERLGRLPSEVWLWGIEIATDRPADEMSVAVLAAVPLVVDEMAVHFAHAQSRQCFAPVS